MKGNYMKQKDLVSKKVDPEKLKTSLTQLIKMSDPFEKWAAVLNEIKPELLDAKSKGISISRIQKTLQESGAKIPHDILKKFLN
jgi:hypothetical protein